MRSKGRFAFFFVGVAPLAAGVIGFGQSRPGAEFSHDVLPILKARCGSCHGANSPSGGLDLTSSAGARKGGISGPMVVPKQPRSSLLIRRLRGLDGKPQMPMGFAPLTAEDLAKIENWIASGGRFDGASKKHWAYVPPIRPEPPKVKNLAWVKNPIDRFVLSKLEGMGLSPSPPASKEELLRRVSLDLVGLPPTLEEIDAFVKDNSPGAYGRVLDRLFASPHYGEKQARGWLDLARYADTNGFEADYSRVMWKWRDWVIQAYNRNIPFDRFTLEQLAGDMLPNATVDQKIATGFHRNTMFNSEGGVDKDEAYFEVLLDRVSTTGTVWLGQTLACARCHDHKYDPFTQKEFYQLYAVWNNLEAKSEGDHNFGQDKLYEPVMEAPTAEQAADKARIQKALAEAETELASAQKAATGSVPAWAAAARSVVWYAPSDSSVQSASGVPVNRQADGSFLAEGAIPKTDTYTFSATLPEGTWRGVRIEALPDSKLPKAGPGRADSGNFILSKLSARMRGEDCHFGEFSTSFVQDGYALNGLFDENGDTGWATWPQAGKSHVLIGRLKRPLVGPGRSEVVLDMNSPTWGTHVLGRFRITFTQDADPTRFAYGEEVAKALASEPSDPANAAPAIAKYAISADPKVRQAAAVLDARKAELADLQAKIPSTLILKEKPTNGKPLTALMRHRGEFLSKGDEVEAGVPSELNPLPKGAVANRLSIAAWLTSPDNPLTARVQVNRIWEQYFGRGLVETSDNFGTQGSPPSHPELLDWLATEFIRLKWDQKAIHRLIVSSATYRQSSNASPALLAKDPSNRWLARGARFRLDAEAIRDNALAISGLLNRKIGGPSVYPVQPDGIWNSPYNGEKWTQSQGGDRYRRGLYTFWKRTSPYPAFMAFDATSREVCTARRERTNTPLQSLTLMNDPTSLEAAKALAGRMLARPGLPPIERVAIGFRLCTARHPTRPESQRLVKLAASALQRYQKDPEAAKKLAEGPEEAAYTLVANTLLNLDETITKG